MLMNVATVYAVCEGLFLTALGSHVLPNQAGVLLIFLSLYTHRPLTSFFSLFSTKLLFFLIYCPEFL